jgi:hypothetical protein
MHAITELGDAIARRWGEQNHDEAAFPAIAADALAESKLLAQHSGADLVDYALQGNPLPAQYFSGFGQPPLALYRGHEFYIEALFWLDSTTSIHQHAFSGAFAVLEGSSVHTRYDFEQHERVTSRMLLGDVQFRECEVLQRGDVRTIESGNRFIHALFHLDRPSVSIVVRTTFEVDCSPQYSYRRPGVAIDPFYEPEPMMTQLRLLESTRDAHGTDAFLRASRMLLERADYWLTYRLLGLAYSKLGDSDPWHDLERTAKTRLGQRIDYLYPIFDEDQRQQNISGLRRQVHDADHRYLLALLLNVPHRREIDRLIRARYGNVDAAQSILRWMKEMSTQRQLGIDLDPLSLLVLEHALNDGTVEDVRTSLDRMDGETRIEPPPETTLRERWDDIVNALLLRPLFAGASGDAATPDAGVLVRSSEAPRRVAFSATLREPLHEVAPLPQTLAVNRRVRLGDAPADGPHAPGRAAWVVDPVRGIELPYWLDAAEEDAVRRAFEHGEVPADPAMRQALANAGILHDPRITAAQRRRLARRMATSCARIDEPGFATLEELVPPLFAAALRRYFRAIIQEGYIRLGDGQVASRYAMHNEPLAAWLHERIAPLVARAVPRPVKPSYSYLCAYVAGAVLGRHNDRPQCEYTLSLSIDATPDAARARAWPLCLDRGEDVVRVLLAPGDALLFRGRQLVHFRDELGPGRTATSLLLHFVNEDFQDSLQ